jgi:hypothetical protein
VATVTVDFGLAVESVAFVASDVYATGVLDVGDGTALSAGDGTLLAAPPFYPTLSFETLPPGRPVARILNQPIGIVNQSGPQAVEIDAVTINPTVTTAAYRQTIAVGDPANPAGLAPVDPLLGLSIASAQLAEVNSRLRLMLAQLQLQTALLGGVSPTADAASDPLS